MADKNTCIDMGLVVGTTFQSETLLVRLERTLLREAEAIRFALVTKDLCLSPSH